MHKRLYAQRKHVIQSLDVLLYQLHVLAFFISPSIWTLVFRLLSQSQCSKSRELDTAWSLRTFFALLVSVNIFTVWSHATSGASDGKTVILDFIGMAYPPSKFRLLSLDVFIVFLQMLLASIAYETSFSRDDESAASTLLPAANPSSSTVPDRTKSYPPRTSSPPYVIDLRFGTVIARLRNPLPPPPANRSLDGLPLPNTAPWPLPASAVGLRMFLGVPPGRPGREVNEPGNTEEANRRIPGALDG
ncbi:hypothetical protein DFH08DRAFT_780244 [Mycena albidolilacea]|uniref:DUF1746 domain-containing protein n=1 Tax=Mycena albidolilacea TaxID=1033008 RepID=A0AAD6ZZQ8_9AGAR|nr:hypothetical protein DFH08DRAFT_780244 [Mycena albidolilacea]